MNTYLYGGEINMNALVEVEEVLKKEIISAIEKADLAKEEEIPSIQLEKPKKEKTHGILLQTLRCSWLELQKWHQDKSRRKLLINR